MRTKILLIIFFYTSSIIAQKDFCVVLDITSDGSVSKNSCSLLSNTINKILESDGRYLLFDRKTLPELLKQFSLYELSQECYSLNCLTRIGNSIGATIIISGKASYKNKSINIVLDMIDTKRKRKIESITLNTQLSKKEVITKEIPVIVEMLLESEKSYQLNCLNQEKQKNKRKSVNKKPSYKRALLYSGLFFAGGISGILCYYMINKEEKKSDNDEPVSDDEPLSLDDVPQRTRYNE